MIYYNSNTINDWNFGDDNIIKVYKHGAVCYYKITSGDTPTPVQEPCFAVVDDISQYSDTEFEDVFNKADGKWYKLNNLSQYEEYGVYGSGRTITTYEGKLTIDNNYEYQYSGGSWVNVGEVSGSSKTSGFTIDDINNDVTVKSSISDGDYYVISYYNHNNPKEPRYMMSYTESNNYLNNFSGYTGSNTITPSTIIDAAIWKFEATSSANTYYIKNIHNNLYWGYQTRASNRSLNLVDGSSSSKAIVKVGVANSATTVGFVELNVNGSRYTYEDGTVGGYALNQLNGYTYRMNWWNTGGWGSDGNSAYYLYKINANNVEYPIYYDEMQDPPDNLVFSSMTEAESYECPWVGMKATIAGSAYTFNENYEWELNTDIWVNAQDTIASTSGSNDVTITSWVTNRKFPKKITIDKNTSGDGSYCWGGFKKTDGTSFLDIPTSTEMYFILEGVSYQLSNPSSFPSYVTYDNGILTIDLEAANLFGSVYFSHYQKNFLVGNINMLFAT